MHVDLYRTEACKSIVMCVHMCTSVCILFSSYMSVIICLCISCVQWCVGVCTYVSVGVTLGEQFVAFVSLVPRAHESWPWAGVLAC